MEKRLMMLMVGLILSLGMAFAQNKITGTVFEDNGEPCIGATVMIQGTKQGTKTDLNGHFTINVPAGKKLVFSYVGMNTQTLTARNGMKVTLQPDAHTVDEVVVTGMQKMDKRLFTGATTKVDASKAKIDGVADISRSLEGRAAGVSVQNVSGTFGTAPKIRVRGATSIYGSSTPLWVVDGVIMEDVVEVSADQLSSGDAETLISSAIAGLNTDDIESFQILKDGSATSIYGARAMAGVIVVTTKRGKAGTSRISYTGEYTMRLKPSYKQYNIMNSQEQMSVYREMQNNGFFSFQGSYRASDSGVFGKMYHLMNEYDPATGFGLANTDEAMYRYLQQAEYRNTDWFDELFSNAISMNHSVGMSSGTDKAQYYTSFSVMSDPGQTKKKSAVQRYTANINANYNLSKHLTLNLIGNAAYRKQEGFGSDNQGTDVVSGAVTRDFDINPYSFALRTSRIMDPNEYYVRNYAPFNIFHELDNNYIEVDAIDAKFQGELKYKPVRTVELGLLGAYKFSQAVTTRKITEYSNLAQAFRMMDDATMRDANPWLYTDPDNVNSLPISVLPNGGFYREAKNKMNYWDIRLSANYNDVFNDTHIVNLLGAIEVDNTDRVASSFNGVGMQYDMGMLGSYDYRFFKQASEDNSIYYSVGNGYTRSAKFFVNANYSYKGRYSFNGTVHYEGSNRMGRSNKARWLPTWNVSASWNAHEEPWFHNIFKETLTHATLRSSYSLTGDKPAITNAMVMIYSSNPWRAFTQDKEPALEISSFANPDLTYEKKHELNLGVDLGFLNNRINVQFDWYTRTNYDLIGPKRTTGVGGTIVNYANVAEMKSHGEEFTISTRNIDKPNFKWNSDFIFSHTHCEVSKLEARNRIIDLLTGSGFTTEGYPYRSLFSVDFRGLNNSGLPTFINQNGELTTSNIDFQSYNTDYLIYEGPSDPTVTGSLGNTLTFWNKLHLNLFVTYSFGNVVRLDRVFASSYSDMSAMPKEFMNRWVVAGDENVTNIPAIADLRQIQADSYLGRAFNAYNYSHERTAKGDFIRMKEISLAYDLPGSWMRALRISNASLKLQATNLFLIYSDKKLNGQDPEFVNAGGLALPMQRQFTFTLRLGL